MNKISFLWGMATTLLYTFYIRRIQTINIWYVRSKSEAYANMQDNYIMGIKIQVISLLIVSIVVPTVLYYLCRKKIRKDSLNNISDNIKTGFIYDGLGIGFCTLIIHILYRMSIKIDPYNSIAFKLLPFPFSSCVTSSLIKVGIMIVLSMLILMACIFIATRSKGKLNT